MGPQCQHANTQCHGAKIFPNLQWSLVLNAYQFVKVGA